MALFEGDPDCMVIPENYPIYFFIWSDKNLVIVSDLDFSYCDELLEFCKGQDTRVSL